MNIEQTLWNPDDVELIGSRIGRLNLNDQTDTDSDGDATDDKADESTDENDDPTDSSDLGENNHNQDDNYALGGHVTRSGSI